MFVHLGTAEQAVNMTPDILPHKIVVVKVLAAIAYIWCGFHF